MNQPAPRPWTLPRVLCLAAAVCEFIAALEVATGDHPLGPVLAWLVGGLSAYFLSGAL